MKAKPFSAMKITINNKAIVSALVAIFFLGLQTRAQQQEKVLTGFIKDSITRNIITNATVSNRNTRVIAEVNPAGFFKITVRPDDLLSFSAQGYKTDTLRYFLNISDTINVELRPELSDSLNVTVKSTNYTKYQQDSMLRRAEFIEDAGPKGKAFSKANSGAGIGLNLDIFTKKKDKQVRTNYKRFEEREKELYIDSRFNPETVQYYTRLKGDTLALFMREHRPEYEWLRKHTSTEDMMLYLNDHLKLFNASRSKE
ncbi:hypothetical protein [Filimonas effusa]|uniref:Carboxypeptidase-like regulatory domain-containing protein n=1 Tax=Filimonas effusa TaxID=2508721 RepID=A0A4Q1D7C3_9BACT|nr:hypothetical protein [Filimonas effusa]RXK83843.1 hypothetical protein ESB13_17385 [Filimonas effusa]